MFGSWFLRFDLLIVEMGLGLLLVIFVVELLFWGLSSCLLFVFALMVWFSAFVMCCLLYMFYCCLMS